MKPRLTPVRASSTSTPFGPVTHRVRLADSKLTISDRKPPGTPVCVCVHSRLALSSGAAAAGIASVVAAARASRLWRKEDMGVTLP
jgi:hypothetical protein